MHFHMHTQGLDAAVVLSNSLQLADKLRLRAALEVSLQVTGMELCSEAHK